MPAEEDDAAGGGSEGAGDRHTPPLGSRPILLLEEVIENAVEIAWRVSQARDGTSDTERSAFRLRLLRQEHLADALELYEPDPTSPDAAEFKAAVQCIRAVCASELTCRSLRA
jgi:hypothetical protein